MLTESKRRRQETGESFWVGTLLHAMTSTGTYMYIYNTAFVNSSCEIPKPVAPASSVPQSITLRVEESAMLACGSMKGRKEVRLL